MGSEASEGLADPDLVAQLAAGSQEALAELYDRYGRLAYSVALRVLGDPGRAEDAVQEAFLRIWNHAASFDERRGSLRTWLLTAVRNRSIDYLRGRGAHERQELELQPALAEVGARAGGKIFGDAADPLLVSVRSGARMSMPGMLDTVLNLGLNDRSVLGLAAGTGNERFAWDSYRRFMQMFANVVRGVPGDRLEAAIARQPADRVLDDLELAGVHGEAVQHD